MGDDETEYEYDENYSGTCGVLAGSAVDQWAGTDIQDFECTAPATWVVQEYHEDAAYACEVHAKAWEANDDNLVFVSKLGVQPVTEDEVQAAIASIMGVAS